jgi:hypothetical protein
MRLLFNSLFTSSKAGAVSIFNTIALHLSASFHDDIPERRPEVYKRFGSGRNRTGGE